MPAKAQPPRELNTRTALRAAIVAEMRANPGRSNREICRRIREIHGLSCSHTTVAKARQEMLTQLRHCVYIINSSFYFAIGHTDCLPKRLQEFQSHTPHAVIVTWIIEVSGPKEGHRVKRKLHRIFKEQRMRPRSDWFDLRYQDLLDIARFYPAA